MKKPLTALRVLRLCNGMTLEETATLLEVSCQQFHNMELLRRKPGYEVLCRLESLFGKPHAELFAEVNSKLLSEDFITERKNGGVTTNG